MLTAHASADKGDQAQEMSGQAPESGGGQPRTEPPAAVQVPNASGHVFISYASQDATVAERLCTALEATGLPCWIAPRNVRAGESYATAIVQAINSYDAGARALDSSHVLREVERASSKKRPVLSVRMDTTELLPDLEYFLSTNQWLDASGVPIEQVLPALVEAVRSHDTAIAVVRCSVLAPPLPAWDSVRYGPLR
jgi:TIR domain